MEVGPIRPLAKGNQLIKVKLADENHSMTATFFGEDCEKFECVKEDNIIAVQNISIDAFTRDWPESTPRNIVIRSFKPETKIYEVFNPDIVIKLQNVADPDDNTFTSGIIKFLSEHREYPACVNCGKGVRGMNVCEKCGTDLADKKIPNHYSIKLIFFTEDGTMLSILSFSKVLQKFEKEGATIEERLSKILEVRVQVKTYTNKDGSTVLEKLKIKNIFDK